MVLENDVVLVPQPFALLRPFPANRNNHKLRDQDMPGPMTPESRFFRGQQLDLNRRYSFYTWSLVHYFAIKLQVVVWRKRLEPYQGPPTDFGAPGSSTASFVVDTEALVRRDREYTRLLDRCPPKIIDILFGTPETDEDDW